jgi:hypothetical protein
MRVVEVNELNYYEVTETVVLIQLYVANSDLLHI